MKLVVLGAGESGVGAAILGKDRGWDVWVSATTLQAGRAAMLQAEGIEYTEGPHDMERVLDADVVVKSPGIPETAPVVRALRERRIPVISEIEWAGRFAPEGTRMVCITGSNGKTTTTTLIYRILSDAGLDVGLAGNIGRSLALQVARDPHEVYVIELSSFQLDNMYDFKANIAVLLNITPDHLDRYDHKFERYAEAKFRILQNQTAADAFIYWQDDPVITSQLRRLAPAARCYPFGVEHREGSAAWVEGPRGEEDVEFRTDVESLSIPRAQLALSGLHNLYNSMAAGLSAALLDIRKDDIRRALSAFEGVEHRLEFVRTVDGVRYINDSKATNVNSTWYALESMPASKSTILLLGGTDKGNDYHELDQLVEARVKAIVCLGADNAKLLDFYGGSGLPLFDTHSVDEALAAARSVATEGDTVLLSPCCASFDLFNNYEHRGEVFKAAVNALAPTK